jgi:multiple sugar transport system substrate-binding protein
MSKQKMISKMSRRDFLKLAGTVSLAGVVAACAKTPAAAPTQATVKPTEVPTLVPPPPEAVTIKYGRHDAVEGDAENVKLFNEKFTGKIKVEQEQIGEFITKVPALAAAGSLPDVLRSWEAMVLDLGRAGQVIDLQPMVDVQTDFHPEDFYENWWKYPIVNDKRVGIPDCVAPHITYYNAQLFDEKGVPYPDKNSFTWDDFEKKARALYDADKKIWGSETQPIGWPYFSIKQCWQNGGDFYSPDYKTCVIDSPESIEAIQYWADLLLDGKVMPSPSQIVDMGGAGAEAQLFQAGKIGMQRMGAWITANAVNGGFKFNIVPEPSKKRRDTITHGAFNAIPATTKNKDQAWQWVNFHCSTLGQYNYSVVGTFPGTRKTTNQMEPHPWIAKVDFQVDWDVVPQALDYGHVLPGPANEGEALKIIGDAIDKVYGGSAKAKDLFPQIAPQVTKILQGG